VNRGFTLIEVLVALSVLSIAVLALLHVQGESAVAARAVRERLFAKIVAENQAVEALATPADPVVGITVGESTVAGMVWRWQQTVAATGNPGIRRVDIAVRGADERVVAGVTVFRETR
jgi:general secretion pathway protein I